MAQAQPGFFEKFVTKYGKKATTQRNAQSNDTGNNTNNSNTNADVNTNDTDRNTDNKDPLAIFGSMFDPPSEERVKAKTPPAFALTPESISKAAEKMDFFSSIPEELKQKMSAGYDPETFMQIVNHAGRSAYARAMEHGVALTGKYIDMRATHEQQGLPEQIRKYLASNSAVGNPNGSDNPVVRKHREAVAKKLADEFPEATPQEIAELTDSYFVEMARVIRPDAFGTSDGTNRPSNTRQDGIAIDDWGSYLQEQVDRPSAAQPAQTPKK